MRICLFFLVVFTSYVASAGHVHNAVSNGDIALVTLLIDEYDEDVNEIEGVLTPLDRARAMGRWDIVRVLLERGGLASPLGLWKMLAFAG